MPVVIEFRCGKEFYEGLGAETRMALGNYLREALVDPIDRPLENIGCYWVIWADSQNMEDLEILVHFSLSSFQGVRTINRISTALKTAVQATTLIPEGAEVGIRPQPILF